MKSKRARDPKTTELQRTTFLPGTRKTARERFCASWKDRFNCYSDFIILNHKLIWVLTLFFTILEALEHGCERLEERPAPFRLPAWPDLLLSAIVLVLAIRAKHENLNRPLHGYGIDFLRQTYPGALQKLGVRIVRRREQWIAGLKLGHFPPELFFFGFRRTLKITLGISAERVRRRAPSDWLVTIHSPPVGQAFVEVSIDQALSPGIVWDSIRPTRMRSTLSRRACVVVPTV